MWFAVATMLVAKFTGNRPMVWLFIVVASTAYLAAGFLAGALRSRYGLYVFGALCSCWLGDMIGPRNFVWGLYAFLGAHVLLVLAFWSAGLDWKRTMRAALVLAVVAVGLMAVFMPNVAADERIDVAAYTIVISTMVAAAWGARAHNAWLVPAAIIFFLSDIFVARWRYGGGAINGYLCYPLYYTSCMFFAMSIRAAVPDGERG
jgi:uncharacterized membrane protein YhhN